MIVRSELRELDEIYLFLRRDSPGRRQFFGCGRGAERATDLTAASSGKLLRKDLESEGVVFRPLDRTR